MARDLVGTAVAGPRVVVGPGQDVYIWAGSGAGGGVACEAVVGDVGLQVSLGCSASNLR